jgi:hypothetical protein
LDRVVAGWLALDEQTRAAFLALLDATLTTTWSRSRLAPLAQTDARG